MKKKTKDLIKIILTVVVVLAAFSFVLDWHAAVFNEEKDALLSGFTLGVCAALIIFSVARHIKGWK